MLDQSRVNLSNKQKNGAHMLVSICRALGRELFILSIKITENKKTCV